MIYTLKTFWLFLWLRNSESAGFACVALMRYLNPKDTREIAAYLKASVELGGGKMAFDTLQVSARHPRKISKPRGNNETDL